MGDNSSPSWSKESFMAPIIDALHVRIHTCTHIMNSENVAPGATPWSSFDYAASCDCAPHSVPTPEYALSFPRYA